MPATIHDITRGASGLPASTEPEQQGASEKPSERLYWRAIVRTGGKIAASRENDRVEWHLVGCEAPRGEGQHCTEGLHNMEVRGQPEGHCVVNGKCALCGDTAPQALPDAA